jgi:hypothetical protein
VAGRLRHKETAAAETLSNLFHFRTTTEPEAGTVRVPDRLGVTLQVTVNTFRPPERRESIAPLNHPMTEGGRVRVFGRDMVVCTAGRDAAGARDAGGAGDAGDVLLPLYTHLY